MERLRIINCQDNAGESVSVSGWVDSRRDHGKLIFIDLRDETGKIQVVFNPKENEAVHKKAQELRPEWVIQINGALKARPGDMKNEDDPNGGVELVASDIKVLSQAKTPPIDISTDGSEIGEEHRLKYRYIDLRRKRMQKNIRNRHKLNQIIRNYLNDEGFTEIETPILTKSTPEGARDFIVPSRHDKGSFYALPQSPQQFKQLLMVSGFERYYQIARCFRDEDTRGDRQAEFTQLDIEMAFPDQEKIIDLVERIYTRVIEDIYKSKTITNLPWPRLDHKDVMKKYGSDRPDLRKNKNDPNELAFAWIINFPLFEKEKVDGHFAPEHHMFTAPIESDVSKLDTDPASVMSYQHDLVLNGSEIGGGSIRIHDTALQAKIFDLIGFDERQKKEFAHILEAFEYGSPPHGGIAMGLDRFLAIMEGEPSIREVIAFPKTGEGRDLMMNAPSEVTDEQLKDSGIEVRKNK